MITSYDLNEKQLENFWKKVDKSGECWEWTGSADTHGYGKFGVNRVSTPAHRISYYLKNGELEDGKVIDHLCRNRKCVNPDHLELVTSRENALRGSSPSIARYVSGVCAKGHAMEGDNVLIEKRGGRPGRVRQRCRVCMHDRAVERWANRSR